MGMEVMPILRNGEKVGSVYRKRNSTGKMHDENSPAVTIIEAGKPDVYEWWRNGSLIATYQNGELKKTTTGEYSDLQTAMLPDKWKNHVGSLSLDDIGLCQMKESPANNSTIDSVKSRMALIRKIANEPDNGSTLKKRF